MRLAEILPRGANNLDLFRIIAAAMVIFGHAYALVPVSGQSDPLAQWLGFDSSGSLAVKVFFLLSGLVVTNSLLDKLRAKVPKPPATPEQPWTKASDLDKRLALLK